MDFDVIVGIDPTVFNAIAAVKKMFHDLFGGTDTRVLSLQVIQELQPPKLVGGSPIVQYVAICTIVNDVKIVPKETGKLRTLN